MAFWNRDRRSTDLITSTALADFGRREFLGADASGIADGYSLVSDLATPIFNESSGATPPAVLRELRRHAAQGEWEKVGAWKFVRNFFRNEADGSDLVDAGLLAIDRMRVTNLAIHLAPIDRPRYEVLTGHQPPNDGFFGPPVFDSPYGRGRDYYLENARLAAERRTISRIESVPGVAPGDIEDAVRSMWDFGMLLYRGPLVVNPNVSFEPNVVRYAVATATGVDHMALTNRLALRATDPASNFAGAWTAIGASRFIEDYLDPQCTHTEAWALVTDSGLEQLAEMGALGVNVAPDCFTPRQRERYELLRGA